MNVEQILKVKGRRVVTASSEASVGEALDLLIAHRIGAVVVTDRAGAVQGIVSERDVVAALSESREDVRKRPVADIMTRDVVTCRLTASVHELMRTMTDRRIRHLPVVEGGKLIGLVSIGDVVKHRVDELESETQQLKDYIGRG